MVSVGLLVFLLLNAVVIGVLLAIGVRHAIAHFAPRHEEKRRQVDQGVHLSAAQRQVMLETAQAKYQAILNKSVEELEKDLATTSGKLSHDLDSLGSKMIVTAVERYEATLEDIKRKTESLTETGQKDMTETGAVLRAKLEADIAADKERLIAQIDTRLGDAMTAFLVDTLGRDVDLGAQEKYILARLEEHKDEIKRGVNG